MLTCEKCNSGELRVLRGLGEIRNLFEVQCLNSKCRKRYSLKLGLGVVISSISSVRRRKRVPRLSIETTPYI